MKKRKIWLLAALICIIFIAAVTAGVSVHLSRETKASQEKIKQLKKAGTADGGQSAETTESTVSEITETEEQTTEAKKNTTQATTEKASESSTEETKPKNKLIVIDPGHQTHANSELEPIGPGASEKKAKVSSGTASVVSGLNEYELNLTVSLKLRDELIARGYDVFMVRTTNDVNLSNRERAEMANKRNADVFIRVHADGDDSGSAAGIMTICQTAGSPYNANIYAKCRRLSDCILKGSVAATGANNRGVWETNTMSGINWSEVPVTILEMGFMSNVTEAKLLESDAYQNKIVQGVANGVDNYFGEEK